MAGARRAGDEADVKLILSPDEWRAILRSPRARYWAIPGGEAELLKAAAPMLLAGVFAELRPANLDNVTIVVDYGEGYHGAKLADPPIPNVMPSRRLAMEARDNLISTACAERAAGSYRQMKLIAVAWQEEAGVIVSIETDDGYAGSKGLVMPEAYIAGKEEAMQVIVKHQAEQVRRMLDGLIRRKLGYPVHL